MNFVCRASQCVAVAVPARRTKGDGRRDSYATRGYPWVGSGGSRPVEACQPSTVTLTSDLGSRTKESADVFRISRRLAVPLRVRTILAQVTTAEYRSLGSHNESRCALRAMRGRRKATLWAPICQWREASMPCCTDVSKRDASNREQAARKTWTLSSMLLLLASLGGFSDAFQPAAAVKGHPSRQQPLPHGCVRALECTALCGSGSVPAPFFVLGLDIVITSRTTAYVPARLPCPQQQSRSGSQSTMMAVCLLGRFVSTHPVPGWLASWHGINGMLPSWSACFSAFTAGEFLVKLITPGPQWASDPRSQGSGKRRDKQRGN